MFYVIRQIRAPCREPGAAGLFETTYHILQEWSCIQMSNAVGVLKMCFQRKGGFEVEFRVEGRVRITYAEHHGSGAFRDAIVFGE